MSNDESFALQGCLPACSCHPCTWPWVQGRELVTAALPCQCLARLHPHKHIVCTILTAAHQQAHFKSQTDSQRAVHPKVHL